MGSRSVSTTTNTAIDNRLAVTDNAFGQSSSGSGNNVTASGNIFNLNGGSVVGYGAGRNGGGSGSGTGGSISLSVLDGGAINRAFDFADTSLAFGGGAMDRSLDFAEKSLSMTLAGVLDAQKLQAQAVTQQANTVASALEQAAQVQADSQADTLAWIKDNAKILGTGAGLLFLGWFFFIRKGRK